MLGETDWQSHPQIVNHTIFSKYLPLGRCSKGPSQCQTVFDQVPFRGVRHWAYISLWLLDHLNNADVP